MPPLLLMLPTPRENGTRLAEIAMRLGAAHQQYRELHEGLHVMLPGLGGTWCTEQPCVLTNHALMQTALYNVRMLERMARTMRGLSGAPQ